MLPNSMRTRINHKAINYIRWFQLPHDPEILCKPELPFIVLVEKRI